MQENILSKKLNLGLNFSTPSGGVTSPLLKESMILTVVDIKKKVLYPGRAEYKSMIQQTTDELNTCFAQKCSSVDSDGSNEWKYTKKEYIIYTQSMSLANLKCTV